jgi:ABC-type branched-subunit amino acid transport system ATPase component
MIEHDMSLVLKICDWIQVLDFGKPLMAGTPGEVRDSEEVRAAYLGHAA